jgi:hypothetical protein
MKITFSVDVSANCDGNAALAARRAAYEPMQLLMGEPRHHATQIFQNGDCAPRYGLDAVPTAKARNSKAARAEVSSA